MEAIFGTIETILAIAMVTAGGAFAIFMGYAIVHLTCNKEDNA